MKNYLRPGYLIESPTYSIPGTSMFAITVPAKTIFVLIVNNKENVTLYNNKLGLVWLNPGFFTYIAKDFRVILAV